MPQTRPNLPGRPEGNGMTFLSVFDRSFTHTPYAFRPVTSCLARTPKLTLRNSEEGE